LPAAFPFPAPAARFLAVGLLFFASDVLALIAGRREVRTAKLKALSHSSTFRFRAAFQIRPKDKRCRKSLHLCQTKLITG